MQENDISHPSCTRALSECRILDRGGTTTLMADPVQQAKDDEDTHQWIARLHRENAQKAIAMTVDVNERAARLTIAGLNIEALRAVQQRIDSIGWQLSHHLSVDRLDLSIDEALNLSALLARVIR